MHWWHCIQETLLKSFSILSHTSMKQEKGNFVVDLRWHFWATKRKIYGIIYVSCVHNWPLKGNEAYSWPGSPSKSASVHVSLGKLCQPVLFWKRGLKLLSNIWKQFCLKLSCLKLYENVWKYMKMSETNKKFLKLFCLKLKNVWNRLVPKTLQMTLYRTLLATCTVAASTSSRQLISWHTCLFI
jgi:hypothetical protein